MASAQYLKMLTMPTFNISTDIRPWGGVSPIVAVDGIVDSISKSPGATYDTATVTLYNASFGAETSSFLPIAIEDDATGITFYRGFVIENIGGIDDSGETMQVKLYCYKWILAKRTMLRGKWYTTKGQISAPAGGMGNGLTAGDGKYDYEKFRGDMQEESGYLQNEKLVFNQGGIPDCMVDNSTGSTLVNFYNDKINYDGNEGLPGTFFASQDFNGYYWSWLTIIRHIFKYWIDPYNTVLSAVSINSGDLTDISSIDASLRNPINFSLDGYNPLTAIDFVVSSLPGKWYWYFEYSSSSATIRIKELKTIVGAGTITLNTCARGDKLVNSDANYSKATVTRNSSKAVANVVGLGGKLKLVTTVRAYPLWTRYGGNDFENKADFDLWKKWSKWYYGGDRYKKDKNVVTITSAKSDRYKRIYRYYGIAEEGGLFGDSIISDDPGAAVDVIQLTGDVAAEYTEFTLPTSAAIATLRNYFFESARIEREMSPPEFKRYSDKIQVFMYDKKATVQPVDSSGADLNHAPEGTKVAENPNPAAIAAQLKRRKWVIPDDEKISYNIDSKNLTILFDKPQMEMSASFRDNDQDKFLEHIKSETYATINSRDVYVTATFATDIASVFGSRITGGFVEANSGAPFSAYVKAEAQEIIIHQNAWYPLSALNKDQAQPDDSWDKCDGNEVTTVMRKCDTFDDYRSYIGEGHVELARAIITWKEGYQDYEENVQVTIPYFTLEHNLGETLTAIGGTNYSTLASYLLGISWQRNGESDDYTTSLDLSNSYNTNRSNIGYAPQKHNENKNKFAERVKFNFFNEKADGALPTL